MARTRPEFNGGDVGSAYGLDSTFGNEGSCFFIVPTETELGELLCWAMNGRGMANMLSLESVSVIDGSVEVEPN